MNKTEIECLEFDLLLEAIVRRYGYDFRNYSRASLERRIRQAMAKFGCGEITDLTRRLIHDPEFFQNMVSGFSVTVTEMFRDPEVYAVIREKVIPYLKTYPFIKVWHAGCATGEEVYSMAILLHEEGLLDRATIYATDFNEASLAIAKEGIYSIEKIREDRDNYLGAGGKGAFSEYYHAQYNHVIMAKFLRKNMTFARHNLVTDHVFGEMHLILCRNVLIYFNRSLQDRVFHLFEESLAYSAFLCLGNKESLKFSEVMDRFTEFDPKLKIYRKQKNL